MVPFVAGLKQHALVITYSLFKVRNIPGPANVCILTDRCIVTCSMQTTAATLIHAYKIKCHIQVV